MIFTVNSFFVLFCVFQYEQTVSAVCVLCNKHEYDMRKVLILCTVLESITSPGVDYYEFINILIHLNAGRG